MPKTVARVSLWAEQAAVTMRSAEHVADVRARPGFAERARKAVAVWRMPDGDDEVLAATLRDMGRYMGAIWSIYLHFTPGGLTLSRLSALLESTNLSAPGRARAMITFMQFLGYIEPAGAASDTRLKHYQPTPRMLAAMAKRYTADLEASAWLTPECARLLETFDQERVRNQMMTFQGELMLAFFRTYEPTGPSLDMFSERFAGMMLLSELMQCCEPDDVFPPAGVLRYSIAGLARSCGVSRTQVRRTLKDAAEQGFLVLGEEGEAWPTPLLRDHVEMAAVGQMSSFIFTAEATLERLSLDRETA